MIYFIAISAIALLLFIWVISVHRTLKAMDENIFNAMSQFSIQLSSKWDTLTLLLELTKGYADHECESLAQNIQARRSITMDSTPEDISKQESMITEAVEKITAIAENYPDLNEDNNYIKMINGVKQYENMLRVSRLIYNDSVSKLNRTIHMFPTFLIAGAMGFKYRAYLEVAEEKANMPEISSNN